MIDFSWTFGVGNLITLAVLVVGMAMGWSKMRTDLFYLSSELAEIKRKLNKLEELPVAIARLEARDSRSLHDYPRQGR